ncbi:type IX secretion system sortase PorU [Prolixibacteraceae bacterium Z1-6]|uniref:Type IX secretion system sortase PorU n=1 Tax=Draconibacterium aestuarii TaxID=2998507 RepID=A0A9X3F7U8_9BACT|nr:type IX secretion system sortase PorU [Prolixibacteraceae bacterium Z1-6]
MKKYLFLFFVILVGFSVDDVQKEIITLEWSEIAGKSEVEATVFFENADLSVAQNELPVYTRLYDLNNTNKTLRFVIENQVFELVDAKNKLSYEDEITADIKISSRILKSGTTQKIELQIIPLKKEGEEIYRLKSFELKRIPDVQKSAAVAMDWKTESVLSAGKWVKISTAGKGIYKIPYSRLKEWGFAQPAQVGVFGSGGTPLSENPGDIAYDDLVRCAVWSNTNSGEDCLFFYAPGCNEWSAVGEGNFMHKSNNYTRIGYFFLGEVGSSQKTVELQSEISETPTQTTTTFDEVGLIENEVYNLLKSGKQWFGDKYVKGSARNYSFTIHDIDDTSSAFLKISAAGRSYITSKMEITAGGTSIGNVQFSAVPTTDTYGLYASEKNGRFGFALGNGELGMTVTYNASNSNAEAWLDYMELNYRRVLRAGNEVVFFRDSKTVGSGNVVQFTIDNGSSATKVFDISDIYNLTEIPSQLNGSTLTVKCQADNLKEYALFNSNGNFEEPAFVNEVENQDLHGLNTPEFLIVSHSKFMSSAEELAAFHREYDGMSVEVVDVEKVYNEFSSGSKSATGIRNFIKMFYDRGTTLKYVLLFGDGSYDNKGISTDSKNFIPTFQSENSLSPIYSFVTDDYFVMLDANESVYNGAIDLGIGRIPAATTYEAQLVVDKVKRYYNTEALGDWRNVICFIGDDGDSGLHMRQSEELADSLNENHSEFISDKIYFDAYVKETTPAGDRYPDVNDEINKRVKEGVLILNYTGHANERFLAHEKVLDISDINSWSNTSQLPIFVTATCEFSRFDDDDTSAGEYVLLNPNGGGIGLFSTTRVVFSSANFKLSKSFYSFIFEQDQNGEHYRMGDVLRLAKTNISSSTNKRNFCLFADPALKLSYPKYRINTTFVNQEETRQDPETLGTLQKVTITGEVCDYFGNRLDNFNGEIIPTVFDKEVEMETLGNGGENPITFKVQENVIYKGLASVKNGNFSFSFVVPKDISYNLGKGKIVYYAQNGTDDAHGVFDNFYLGGNGSDVSDNKGPEIELYLDSQDFESGDKTTKNPTMLAFLSDENGINTVGTGIGHDITAVIDNDYSNVIVLNKYYQAEKDDYTSGTLQYPLRDLTEGKHTLKLKAWDVANNSSEVEIEFEVSGDFSIDEVSNYPNPVSDYTYFVLKHNQPDASLTAIFDIYNQNGQKIDQFQTEVSSNGNSTNPVRWDITESRVAVTSGVYIYNAIVQNADGVIVSKSGKMIISR